MDAHMPCFDLPMREALAGGIDSGQPLGADRQTARGGGAASFFDGRTARPALAHPLGGARREIRVSLLPSAPDGRFVQPRDLGQQAVAAMADPWRWRRHVPVPPCFVQPAHKYVHAPMADAVGMVALLLAVRTRALRYYHPLYERAVATLGVRPTNITADADFDAWHSYETCAPDGLAMRPSYPFAYTDGYRAEEFRCPLLHPRPTGQTCPHAQFVKGPGCVKHINIERGGLMRALLDRDFPRTRTSVTNGPPPSASTPRPKLSASSAQGAQSALCPHAQHLDLPRHQRAGSRPRAFRQDTRPRPHGMFKPTLSL